MADETERLTRRRAYSYSGPYDDKRGPGYWGLYAIPRDQQWRAVRNPCTAGIVRYPTSGEAEAAAKAALEALEALEADERAGTEPAHLSAFELAEIANAKGAKRAQLEALQRQRSTRLGNAPMPEGGLFDEVRRNTMELF